MSKKHFQPTKRTSENNFDFSSLLTYCNEEEKEAFRKGLTQHPVSSLILNQKNYQKEQLLNSFPDLKEDTCDPLLYRFDKSEDQLGKTLEHFGGAFYILDPSSAAISYYLAPLLKKDFLSIDLCAAPGGKTIALDCRRPDGIYLANDIAYDRALEIVKNTDRLGLTNVLSLSIDPQKLSLPCMFDLVILDVPCSGSGMIRKEPKMKQDWSTEKMERLLPIQSALLEKAYSLCKKDGIIAYSTCALSTEEDEAQVKAFLSRHNDMELIPIQVASNIKEGQEKLGYHLIPGIYDGEGIYFAFLHRKEAKSFLDKEIKYKEDCDLVDQHIISYRKNRYVVKKMYSEWVDLPFISPGIKINDDSDHPKCDFDHAYSKIGPFPEINLNKQQALDYVSGNEIRVDSTLPDGLSVLCYQSLKLGFGKKVAGRVKNYLPKGLKTRLF